MLKYKKIRIGKKHIQALSMRLGNKYLVVFRGSKGYIMCGYLDMNAADKFNDIAVKIIGISGISQALKAKVFAASPAAKRLGIYEGQPIKEVIKIIA